MNGEIRDVERWYREQHKTFGVDYRSLGYNRQSSQTKRFEVLRQLGRFDGRSVLDMGCGFGDFYRYLQGCGESPRYTGVDLTPEFVAECRTRFAGDQGCTFESGDVLQYQPAQPFDFVVACGIFGLKTDGGASILSEALTRLYSWCTVGLAVNFLSLRAPRRAERSFYVDPANVVKQALRLTPSIRLSHDYLPNDFTLFLYRTPAWQADTTKELSQ